MLQTDMPIQNEQVIEVRPSSIVRIFRWLLQFALMVTLIVAAISFMSRSMDQKTDPVSRSFKRSPLQVTATTVEFKDNRPSFVSYGRVIAANQLDIKSAVSGKVVWVSPNLQVGRSVTEGEELLRIDDFSYVSSVSEAEAEIKQTKAALVEADLRLASEKTQLEGAKAQLRIAQTDLTRAEQLVQQGAATRKQIDDREVIVSQRELAVQQRENNIEIEGARQAQQQASLERLELKRKRAERALLDTIIKSPIDGRLGLVAIETGQEINTQSTLARLNRTDSLDVDFTLTDAQFGRLLEDNMPIVGRVVEVKWIVGSKESQFQATISRLGAEINAELGGVQIFASLDDPQAIQALRPGAFVEIEVPDRKYRQSAVLPETSVYDGDTVYRIDENGRLISAPVEVAAYSDGKAIIIDGVEEGQTILTTRLSRITGRSVQIIDQVESGEAEKSPEANERQSSKLVERVKLANKLTDEQWQSKTLKERRTLISNFRKRGNQ